MIGYFIVMGYFLGRLADVILHFRHFSALKGCSIQTRESSMPYIFMALDFVCPVLLLVLSHSEMASPTFYWQLSGLGMVFLGFSFKVWSQMMLGARWTFACVRVNGYEPVQIGPYRYLKHPEYAGRVAEIVGVALVLGLQQWALPVAVLYGLVLRRIGGWEHHILTASDEAVVHQ